MHVLGTCKEFGPLFIFQGCRPASGRIRLKLCGLMASIGGQYSLGYPVISGTSSTCQRGGNFKHGILRVCEFLSWRHQTRRIGTSGQGHHHAVYKNDVVHVARAWHVHRICTSFYLFQAAGQTNRLTRLKIREYTALMGVGGAHVPWGSAWRVARAA